MNLEKAEEGHNERGERCTGDSNPARALPIFAANHCVPHLLGTRPPATLEVPSIVFTEIIVRSDEYWALIK